MSSKAYFVVSGTIFGLVAIRTLLGPFTKCRSTSGIGLSRCGRRGAASSWRALYAYGRFGFCGQ